MKAFFFGAGSSRGTVGAPVAREFGFALNVMDPNWQIIYPALLQVVQHLHLPLHDWSLESVWSCMDYYAKLRNAIGTTPPWTHESPQFKRAILTLYGQRCDRQADRLPRDDSYTLGRILQNELQLGDRLISFNYDTIVERLARRFFHNNDHLHLRQADYRYTNYDGQDAIVLAKPHGSTSWILRDATGNTIFTANDGNLRFDSLTDTDVDAGREPLVLGAVPIKSELIFQVQQQLGVPAVFQIIQEQWRAVVRAIRDADSLVIVGYSFPPEDQYGRFLMQEGVRQRNRRPLDIEFYALNEQETENRIREIFQIAGVHIERLRFLGQVTGPRQT